MYDFEQLDHYQILGIDRTATADEIKRAFRQAISIYHPDRFVSGSPEEHQYASARTQRINEAYRVLGEQASRSRYNLGQSEAAARSRPTRTPPPPPQPRDHLAELYTQAQEHLSAGRAVQAAAVLRQLQQLSPLYRDSAELLAKAVRRSGSTPQDRPAPDPRTRRVLAAASIGGVLALGAIAWLIGGRAATGSAPTPSVAPESTSVAAVAAAPTSAATLAATSAPRQVPSAALAPTAAPLPTEQPTEVPTALPTEQPTEVPTALPTEQPTEVPTPLPEASNLEDGALILTSSFDGGSGWALASGNGWSVGEENGVYRVVAAPGIGDIWSYRTLPAAPPLTLGVDVQVSGGAAGLIFRFVDGESYLSFVVDQQVGSWRVASTSVGGVTTIAEGSAAVLQPGVSTRLTVVQGISGAAFAIDGQLVADLDLTGLPDGAYYGLAAVATDQQAAASFDNLEIRAVE